ncbi:hypothetical protein [Vreelandella sedimenti]|uniref:hypothetical protein n=1 Tax=Vreelandella sedimenti TaxID=2729618 RepID=UPI00257F7D01|nr:hypothetical protein [Halomonas sp. UBA3173]|tara:strand:+ start:2979 stop:3320 length:342 start_codon:yes stop_codon:yes gene_type:complete
MSLVLKKIPTTTVDVPVQVPGDKKPATLQAEWILHKWDKYREVVDASKTPDFKDEDLLEDLKGLSGIKDEEGNDLLFNKALVEELMQETYIRRPLILSWFAAQEGRNQAAAKN